MRTLSLQEITQTDQRLESLKIQYLEIYHELRDHYFTELEKKPTEEFEVTFLQLNETFAWSVVKKMEKELRKITNKKIAEWQWDALNIWKLKWWEVSLAGILLIAFPIMYIEFGLIDLMTITGLISLFCAIVIWTWIAIKGVLNFSLTRHKPIPCASAELFGRMVFPLGSYSWLYFGAKWISEYNTPWLIDFTIILLILFQVLFLLTLSRVIWSKKFKLA